MSPATPRPVPRSDSLYREEYPEGWYALETSRSLKRGAITDIDFANRPLVLFRTESGSVGLMDRHCIHMGASLACGRVKGERIVCPFHEWEYGVDGRCEKIPYEEDIPRNARLATVPFVEHLGMIWMYHGAEPAFALPEVPEFGMKGWLTKFKSAVLDCHQLLILENPCDLQHLTPIHGLKFDGGRVDLTRNERHDFEIALNLQINAMGKTRHIKLVVHYVGPAALFFTLYKGEDVLSKWYIAVHPMSGARTTVHLVSIGKRLPLWLAPLQPVASYLTMRQLFQGMTADYTPIWKRQDTNWRRVLVRADGVQQKYRKFYEAHLPESGLRRAAQHG